MTLTEKIFKNWFLIGIVFFIVCAYSAPWVGQKGGPLHPEITIKYVAVFVIFFNSGLSLRSEDLKVSLFHYRLHLFIQCFTFIFIPLAMSLLIFAVRTVVRIHELLLRGLLVVSCMPPPVSSAVIITKAIGGNEAGAIFNSAFGSFLGISVTPVLLFNLVGVSGSVPIMNIVRSLTITVILPLVFGQIVRSYIKVWLEEHKPPLGQVGSFMLLMIIYTTFCDTFASNDVDGVPIKDLLLVMLLIIAIQLSLLMLIFIVGGNMTGVFCKKDVVAMMFCATHKSLTLGMPILKILYMGDPMLPFTSVPLLIYHPTQILLGGFLVPIVKNWLHNVDSANNSAVV